MIGETKLVLNKASIMEATAYWINEQFSRYNKVYLVTDFKVQENHHGDLYEISFEETVGDE